MGKTKKYFLIYQGKQREIAKQEFTRGGSNAYTIPAPEVQKELGTDLHFSSEADGKIQHLKSRKLDYQKEGSLWNINLEVFQNISESASSADIPKEAEGVQVTPFRIQELVNKHSFAFEHLRWEFFNLDKFNFDLSQEERAELEKIDQLSHDKIAFFYTSDYIFYYFNKEWKKIRKDNFYLLKKYEE